MSHYDEQIQARLIVQQMIDEQPDPLTNILEDDDDMARSSEEPSSGTVSET
jgi:hypothetical protein